jgi:hypothetical protein
LKKVILVSKFIDVRALAAVAERHYALANATKYYCQFMLRKRENARMNMVGMVGGRFRVMGYKPVLVAENRAICERAKATLPRPVTESVRDELRRFMGESKIYRVHIDHFFSDGINSHADGFSGNPLKEAYAPLPLVRCEDKGEHPDYVAFTPGNFSISQSKCLKTKEVPWEEHVKHKEAMFTFTRNSDIHVYYFGNDFRRAYTDGPRAFIVPVCQQAEPLPIDVSEEELDKELREQCTIVESLIVKRGVHYAARYDKLWEIYDAFYANEDVSRYGRDVNSTLRNERGIPIAIAAAGLMVKAVKVLAPFVPQIAKSITNLRRERKTGDQIALLHGTVHNISVHQEYLQMGLVTLEHEVDELRQTNKKIAQRFERYRTTTEVMAALSHADDISTRMDIAALQEMNRLDDIISATAQGVTITELWGWRELQEIQLEAYTLDRGTLVAEHDQMVSALIPSNRTGFTIATRMMIVDKPAQVYQIIAIPHYVARDKMVEPILEHEFVMIQGGKHIGLKDHVVSRCLDKPCEIYGPRVSNLGHQCGIPVSQQTEGTACQYRQVIAKDFYLMSRDGSMLFFSIAKRTTLGYYEYEGEKELRTIDIHGSGMVRIPRGYRLENAKNYSIYCGPVPHTERVRTETVNLRQFRPSIFDLSMSREQLEEREQLDAGMAIVHSAMGEMQEEIHSNTNRVMIASVPIAGVLLLAIVAYCIWGARWQRKIIRVKNSLWNEIGAISNSFNAQLKSIAPADRVSEQEIYISVQQSAEQQMKELRERMEVLERQAFAGAMAQVSQIAQDIQRLELGVPRSSSIGSRQSFSTFHQDVRSTDHGSMASLNERSGLPINAGDVASTESQAEKAKPNRRTKSIVSMDGAMRVIQEATPAEYGWLKREEAADQLNAADDNEMTMSQASPVVKPRAKGPPASRSLCLVPFPLPRGPSDP